MDRIGEDLRENLERATKNTSGDEERKNLNDIINAQKQVLEVKERIGSLSEKQAEEELKRVRETRKIIKDYRDEALKLKNSGVIDEKNYEEFEKYMNELDKELLRLNNSLSAKTGGAFSEINNFINDANESAFSFADQIDSTLNNLERGFTGQVIKLNESFLGLKTDLGLTLTQLDSFSKNIKQASTEAGILGFDIEKIIEFQKELSRETGTYNILSREDIERVAVLRRALPELQGELPQLVAAFDRLGFGPTEAVEAMSDIVKESNKAGVNANKVAKNVSKTLQDASLLARFRDGIQDITKMAIQAEKFKLSMDTVFKAAEKGRDLEGSIDAVSQLNLLGGRFAEIDPFSFLDMSRNDPEALQRTIADMVSDLGTLQEDGTIGFSSVDIDRIRAAADAMGISFEDLRRSAERTAKLNVIDSLLPTDLTDEQKNLIANFAQVRKGGKATVEVDGFGTVDISQINDEQLAVLQKMQEEQDKTTLDKQAEAAISSAEYLRNINETISKGLLVNLTESPLRTETNMAINSGVRSFFGGQVGDFAAQAYGPGDATQKAEQVLNYIQNDLPKQLESFFTGSLLNNIMEEKVETSTRQIELQTQVTKIIDDNQKQMMEFFNNLKIKADLSESNINLASEITINLDGSALKKLIVEQAPEIIAELNKQDAGQ